MDREPLLLAFDVASRTGWAVGNKKGEIIEKGNFNCKSYVWAQGEFRRIIEKFKPTKIITAKPNRYYNVIRKQSEITGLLLEVAEEFKIPVDKTLVDKSCKKEVLGNGNSTKDDIMAHFNCEQEDEADAMMFIAYYLKMNKWKK